MAKELPGWIEEYKRRISLLNVIVKAYEDDCKCEVCSELRRLGKELESMFPVPGRGTQPTERRRIKYGAGGD